jgi:hypothetical protein
MSKEAPAEEKSDPKSSSDKAKDRQKKAAFLKRYNTRITVAKHAREAFQKKEFPLALKKYNEYLVIMAEMAEVEDIFSIEVDKFDPKAQLSEMLLISHIYWEMGRIYELTPKFQEQYTKCLNQFVKFTVNQPYQVFNAEMLRKYIKNRKKSSPYIKLLESTYARIYVESDKCFIATMCFGKDHYATQRLRKFKLILLKNQVTKELVRYYYQASPHYVRWSRNSKILQNFNFLFIRPLLYNFSKLFK